VTSRWWSDDEQFFAAVQDALREAREVPCRFIETGEAAFAWRTVDAELAAITYDSAAGNHQPIAATRAERAALRELTFSSRELKIHLQVADNALQGQIVPPQRCEIEVRTADGPPLLIRTDDDGWFTVQPIPIGSFRLHCRIADTTALTDWLAV
jgi:hypothetical protein